MSPATVLRAIWLLGGSLLSALVTFGIGTIIGRRTLRDLVGPKLDGIRKRVVRKGVIAVALILLVPVAVGSVKEAISRGKSWPATNMPTPRMSRLAALCALARTSFGNTASTKMYTVAKKNA